MNPDFSPAPLKTVPENCAHTHLLRPKLNSTPIQTMTKTQTTPPAEIK
jgi:hypothetical protein